MGHYGSRRPKYFFKGDQKGHPAEENEKYISRKDKKAPKKKTKNRATVRLKEDN